MAQLFPRHAITLFRGGVLLALFLLAAAAFLVYALSRSDRVWRVGVPEPQPVPFSHAHHVGGLGIDCRYCHSSVETAAFAGMPPAETCMSCHSQVWIAAAVLAPVQRSYELDEPIVWTSVHRLPEFSHFHHGIHVSRGVACETCHGRVDRMPETVKAETLSMGWCLDCHRDPGPRLRPREYVFVMGWEPTSAEEVGLDLVDHYGVAVGQLTDCTVCHY